MAGAAILCAVAQDAVAGQTSLQFDNVFKAAGEPAALFYRATFTALDGPHSLQVWRDGQLHLRRKTDESIDTYVIRDRKDLSKYQMIIVDYNKHITTKIDRNNLIHLGNFSDWFDMAHGVRHPKANNYQLTSSNAPADSPKPISACQWYALSQGTDTHHICWSPKEHLPLIIWSDRTAKAVWQVTDVAHSRITKDIFMLHDKGFVRNDANADIEGD
jgi:hypothetical protein